MTVYIIQDNGALNFSKAKRWGKFVTLIERDAFPDDGDERMKSIYHIMKAKLADFSPVTDHLLLTGAPEAIASAIWVLGEGWNEIPVLKWDRDNKGYYELLITSY